MPNTVRTGFSLLTEGQASAEITQNALNNIYDSLVGGAKILEYGLNTPPGSPSDGDAYVIGSSPTGDWASNADDFTVYFNGWLFITPFGGMKVFDHNAKEWLGYSSVESDWHPLQRRWSTTEHWTGKYVEGSKVYAKVVDCGTAPNATVEDTAHSISTIDFSKPILIVSSVVDNTNDVVVASPMYATVGAVMNVAVDTTNVKIYTNFDYTSFQVDVYLEYCKV